MKIIKNPTFRMNLALWLIILVTISTAFFFILYYSLSKNSLNNIVKDNLTNISKNKADYINTWLNDNQKFIEALAKSENILNDNSKVIENNIANYNTLPQNFQEIVFADATGKTVYSSLNSKSVNISDRKYFEMAKQKKNYISEKLMSKTRNEPIIVISSPIIKDNKFVGVVAGGIKTSKITDLITPNTYDNINKTFIVTKTSKILTSSNLMDKITSDMSSISNSVSYQKNIKNAINSEYFIDSYTNYQGQKVLGSFTLLNQKNWVLVSEVELSKQMFLLKEDSLIAGIVTLFFTTILLIPFVLYLTRKLIVPIKNITSMASELEKGNFSNRINYDSSNEIGLLADSFNSMADKLQNTYLELRKKISDLNSQKEEINYKNLKLQQVIEVNKTILKQLEDKNDELEQANKIKAEFLSTMTHELRTPMNSIIGYTEMILDGNDGEINKELEKDLKIILKSSEKLLGLINDVLGLSKIEAGKMNYNFKRFNIVDEISNLIEDIRVMAENKNLDLIYKFDENIPEIYSDPGKINHIITNILSNAVKFTDEGFIKVKVGIEDKKYAKITVEDTGIGIPKKELNSIFDEFKQIDGSSTRKYGGTGLGLTIAKAFAEGLGGSISVYSILGKGSKFTLKVPVSKFSKVITETAPLNVDTSEIKLNLENPENKRIVVITKNSSSYQAIKDVLSKHDFKVFSADYPHAIETAREIKPGCIFIDIDVPCTSCSHGWTALLDLKQDKSTAYIPKVVITTQIDEKLCFTLGASDYLIKPIKSQDLQLCVNRCYSEEQRGYTLLIDDNKDNINLVSKAIRKNTSYSTLIVTSLKDISNVLESSNLPKFIVLNAGLSKVKSFEIIRKISKLNLKKKIPVIIISDRELSKLEHEFLKQGCTAILTKSDIRYSNIVGEIKKIILDSKKYDIIS